MNSLLWCWPRLMVAALVFLVPAHVAWAAPPDTVTSPDEPVMAEKPVPGAAWEKKVVRAPRRGVTDMGLEVMLKGDGTWEYKGEKAGKPSVLFRIARWAQDRVDVAVLCGEQGIRLMSGQRIMTLLGKPVDSCIVDARSQVIWVRVGAKLKLLDLLSTSRALVGVVRGIPDEVSIRVIYPKEGSVVDGATHNDGLVAYVMVGDGTVEIGGLGNFAIDYDEDSRKEYQKKLRVIKKSYFPILVARRALAPPVRPPISAQCPQKVAEVPEENCDAGGCGETESVPGTDLCRVQVYQSCGDGCYVDYAFYDPQRKAFLHWSVAEACSDPGEDIPDPSYDMLISPSRVFAISRRNIYEIRGRVVYKGDACGWLGVSVGVSGGR